MTVKLRVFFATWFVLSSMVGWANIDIETQDIGSEKITQPAKRAPFSFDTYVDVIGSEKIRNKRFEGDHVHFAEAEVEGGMVVYYCPAYSEGAKIALSYTATYLKWSENPWFDQDHFNIVSLTFAGFTKRLDRWFWRSQFSINIDSKEWSAPYTSYDILLWGRYAYCKNVGIHLGFLAQTGLRLDRVFPIFGADWQISRDWRLNLVYPMNISLTYALTRNWLLAIAGRTFNSRFRAHNNGGLSKALIRYINTGAEFAVKYETGSVSANIHAGSTLGGRYRIADRKNHHARNLRLKPAGYVGAEMDVSF
jgi:hypothetical protein